MLRRGAELWLSPTSRTRLNVEAIRSELDEFDEFLAGGEGARGGLVGFLNRA